MVKLPKQVKEIIRTLKDKGFDAYAAGQCVRDSLHGLKPLDWDVITDARLDALKELFPEAKVLSERLSVIRLYDQEDENDIITDIATYRKKSPEGSSEVLFTDNVMDELTRRDFTVNAMADNGSKIIDEFGGKSDVQAKLVRTIGDAGELFRKEPIKILKALRITAELGYDLTKDVYEAIIKERQQLRNVPNKRIGKEFLAILGGKNTGKAVNMIVDMGLLGYVLGETGNNLSSREKSDLMVFCKNCDKTLPVGERRIGALLSILSTKKALAVIDYLEYEGKLKQHLEDVARDLPSFHFAQQPQVYKKFIYEHAPMERSEYLLNLQKALLMIFDYSIDTKIKSKMFLLKEFERTGEPIFVEDLAIDADDLMEEGILDDPEECDKMLHMLIERLHIEPKKNTRTELLKLAKVYKKNKLKAYFRGVSWIH